MIREFLENTLSSIVSIPSTSGNEDAISEFIFGHLKKSGVTPQRDEDGNVWLEIGTGDKVLHVNAHQDTVVPVDGWKTDPFTPHIDGDFLFGLGSTDCGSGLAALLWLAPRVKPNVRTIFSWTVCEEGVGHDKQNGSRKMAAMGGDWAISCEPTCTENAAGISLGTQGHARAMVTFPGKAAHSSRPELGDNAIYKASRFCLAIEELNAAFREVHVYENVSARSSAAATVINGGKLSNIIPDSCSVMVSRRLGPGESGSDFEKEIAGLLESSGPTTEFWCDGPCATVDLNGPLFATAKRCSEELLGEAHCVWQRGRTDGVIYAGAGMDAVTIGPGLIGQSHVANEHTNLKTATQCVELLEQIINTLE